MTAPSRTVALVDDHELVVTALTAALTEAGVASSALAPRPPRDLLQALTDLAPTAVLLDLNLGPHGDATPLIEPLTAAGMRIVVLTGETDHARLGEALEAGAVRVIEKSAAFEALVDLVRQLTVFDHVPRDPRAAKLLTELAAHRAETAAERAPFDELTEREQQTLSGLARGMTVQEMATRWFVAETTIRSHIRGILHKLGARSQLQAVVRAVHHGWVDPGEPSDYPLGTSPDADPVAATG